MRDEPDPGLVAHPLGMGTRNGLSLIEVLLVLAVLAILAAIAWPRHGAAATRAAAMLARDLAHGRAIAVIESRGVAITACPGRPAWPSRLPPTIRIEWPTRGLAFGPDGLPRSCTGGLGNTTLLLHDRSGGQAAVLVSSLGRVRWEPR